MNIFLIFFTVLEFTNEIICFGGSNIFNLEEDVFRNASELITSKGYLAENHIVETFDGYLLSLQRIPQSRKETITHDGKISVSSGKRRVVLAMHGLLSDSSNFVWDFRSLGFVLADNGYDVWLGNIRGCTYSRNHVRLSPNSEEFWDFSFDEMIKYDLPAMIDYILNKTGQNQLSYIGHSQGSTIAFGLLSLSPLYNKKVMYYKNKINIFIALAPFAKLRYTEGIAKYVFPAFGLLEPIYKIIGYVETFPHRKIYDFLKVVLCGPEFTRFICAEILFSIFGFDEKQLNYTRLPVYFNTFPAGTSTKNMIHYSQMTFSNKLQMYDYRERNMEIYKQDTPPVYDVSKITTPTAMFSGLNDLLAPPSTAAALRPKLKSLVSDYIVPYDDFNHGDFLYAIDVYPLVYKKVLSLFHQYN